MSKTLVSFAAASALLAAPLLAKDNGGDPPTRAAKIVDELTACRTIAVDAERLACFDRTAAALETARADKQVVVIDREDVRKTKRSLFGFTLPKINLFGGGKDDDDGVPEIKEIDSTLKNVRSIPNGLFVVTLADDSTWQFTDPPSFPPRGGDTIKIEKAAFGSFKASVKGRIAVKIKRVN